MLKLLSDDSENLGKYRNKKQQNFSIRQYWASYTWGLFALEIALLLPESICKPDYYTKKLQRTSTDFIHISRVLYLPKVQWTRFSSLNQ